MELAIVIFRYSYGLSIYGLSSYGLNKTKMLRQPVTTVVTLSGFEVTTVLIIFFMGPCCFDSERWDKVGGSCAPPLGIGVCHERRWRMDQAHKLEDASNDDFQFRIGEKNRAYVTHSSGRAMQSSVRPVRSRPEDQIVAQGLTR